jgi:prevent-host-death family protein
MNKAGTNRNPPIHIDKIARFSYTNTIRYKEAIMVITATELKANMGQYFDIVAEKEEVYITKNGKVVAKLSSPVQDKQALLDSLVGITAHNPVSLEEARRERLSRQ